ncbi:peptidylprolyl isomerase [Nocardiopsis algeriensis]|uniref:Peptidyl-prolyl cis-trans isomerase n=1 Tax=Nocardiopsis algeriensis TaxID=1478215 RepID=A0A841IJ72_9ACTN|nr:peptidylprolyl isomerase [Nocardiopsis algeriensis]MBB6118787.1 peptidyl-prolyl cis-trans isomerase A (cyclophilin A) [Nocardiopsis algeriensis]
MTRATVTASSLLAGALLFTATACSGNADESEPEAAPDSTAADTDAPEFDVEGTADVEGATLHTSEGDIRLELLPETAPKTVANFVGLAEGTVATNPVTGEDEFYDGTIFHRVIDGFMIQGGDPQGTGTGGPGYEFEDEVGTGETFEEPGVLAMANSGPGTNGSQFFITVAPTPHLQDMHTIFGHVADEESMEVVYAISRTETGPNDRPAEDVTIESVTVHRGE